MRNRTSFFLCVKHTVLNILLRNDLTAKKTKEKKKVEVLVSNYMFVNNWIIRSGYSVAVLVLLIVRPSFSQVGLL